MTGFFVFKYNFYFRSSTANCSMLPISAWMADTLFKMVTAFLLFRSKIQKALKQRFICSYVKILLKLRDSLLFRLSLRETLPIPLNLQVALLFFSCFGSLLEYFWLQNINYQNYLNIYPIFIHKFPTNSLVNNYNSLVKSNT